MRDRFRYFRIEARELLDVLVAGILEVERAGADPDRLRKILRAAHTLKGAARVVGHLAIAQAAHSLEEVLAPFSSGDHPIDPAAVQDALALLDAMKVDVLALSGRDDVAESPPAKDPPAAISRTPSTPGDPDRVRTVAASQPPPGGQALPSTPTPDTAHVDLMELDQLLEALLEAGVHLEGLRQDFDSSSAPSAEGEPASERSRIALERAQGVLREAHERATAMRLIPCRSVFGDLERACRDAALAAERRVVFEARGGEVAIDGHVLAEVKSALLHVVRNAAFHGIETEPHRLAAGKPPIGVVRLTVQPMGRQVVFAVSDDGRGLDLEAIGRAAEARGLVAVGTAGRISAKQAAELVQEPGMSTVREQTEVAGRGMGLDVARDVAVRLGGEIAIESDPASGTTVRLTVPSSLSRISVLEVQTGDLRILLPAQAVQRVVLLSDRQELAATLALEDAEIPLVALAPLIVPGPVPPSLRSAVVLEAEGKRVALAIERPVTIREVAVRPVPVVAQLPASIRGVAFDAQGQPVWVVEPRALIGEISLGGAPAARTGSAERTTGSAEGSGLAEPSECVVPEDRLRPLSILVVDDSLTTRMLEKSILESAGYAVDLAASGPEGLTMATQRAYGLLLVDIEMPEMDGFEFVALIRSDPRLREIPFLFVTSLSSPEHRQRAMDAGARDFVVKGAFDQTRFLQTIRTLVG